MESLFFEQTNKNHTLKQHSVSEKVVNYLCSRLQVPKMVSIKFCDGCLSGEP